MTTVQYVDDEDMVMDITKLYTIPATSKRPNTRGADAYRRYPISEIQDVERAMVRQLEGDKCTILSINSELISKRRYKRKLAKVNKRRAILRESYSS